MAGIRYLRHRAPTDREPTLGAVILARRGAELLFQVLTEREENNSIAIAPNESFSGWTKMFTDPRLCAPIVDQLAFNGAIVETGTELLSPRPQLGTTPAMRIPAPRS